MEPKELFQSVEKPRLSAEIARQIAQAIREGRLLPGETLPPERELTRKFDVSRPILREALRILEFQGFIEIEQGRGTFIKHQDVDILNVPLESWLPKNHQIVQRFYEARLAIEPACAELAAQRATSEQIADLREMVTREEEIADGGNIALFVRHDIDFHSMIAELSGNTLLHQILNSLIFPETDVRKIILRLPYHLSTAHRGHLGIVEAIEKRDPEAARQAMVAALNQPMEAVRNYMSRINPQEAP